MRCFFSNGFFIISLFLLKIPKMLGMFIHLEQPRELLENPEPSQASPQDHTAICMKQILRAVFYLHRCLEFCWVGDFLYSTTR